LFDEVAIPETLADAMHLDGRRPVATSIGTGSVLARVLHFSQVR
jgi:hypothetical protein